MISFEAFMTRVNRVVARAAGGFTSEDFADAPWYDLYEDTYGNADADDIIELLSIWDGVFASLVAASS